MKPKHGDLKFWWIAQLGTKMFEHPVSSLEEGRLLDSAFARYDQHLLDQRIRPDFCNAGGVSVWDEDCPDDEGDCWIDIENYDSEDIDIMRAETAEKEKAKKAKRGKKRPSNGRGLSNIVQG